MVVKLCIFESLVSRRISRDLVGCYVLTVFLPHSWFIAKNL